MNMHPNEPHPNVLLLKDLQVLCFNLLECLPLLSCVHQDLQTGRQKVGDTSCSSGSLQDYRTLGSGVDIGGLKSAHIPGEDVDII